MKLIILTAFLFCCSNVKGQNPDTIYRHEGNIIKRYSVFTDSSISLWQTVTPDTPVYDTVRCVMLVSDTSFNFYLTLGTTDLMYNAGRVGWILGYEVKEKYYDGMMMSDGMGSQVDHYYWIHYTYLDADRKRLDKNILVWQSR